MQAIAIVLILGSFMNAMTPKPHNVEQFHEQYRKQFEHPVVVPDYSNLNK